MTNKVQWKRLDGNIGQSPKPRHGHRAVAVKDLIIIFGGGNEGIVEDLNVYNCATNQWFQPVVRGEIPTGCAAFGFATDGQRILVFGGMTEYGKYSADLWELNPIKWEWRKLKARPPRTVAPPCPRLGHTLTFAEGKFYLFGGLANESKDPRQNVPKYLNDLYVLEYKGNLCAWEQPIIRGTPPSERESHTCLYYRSQTENRPKLLIYGGMNGHRLEDLWTFYLDFSQWAQIISTGLAPQPRSLHTSVILGHRMFVFGGWVPLVSSDKLDQNTNEKEWKCSNTLASFNLETNAWELLNHESSDETIPRARAGHCAIAVNTRMYIWSGRDGYRKAWNNQVCCKDFWCLETACPGEPEKVQLVKAGIANLEISWTSVPTADSYIIQIQRVETPIEPTTPVIPAPVSTPTPTVLPPPLPPPPQSLPLQSIFASKSPQSVLASLIPTFSSEPQPAAAAATTTAASASVSAISDSDVPIDPNLSLTKTTVETLSQLAASTLPNVSLSPSNSTTTTMNNSLIFQKNSPSTSISYQTPTVRPATPTSTIQFTTNNNVRPLIFHQKTTNSPTNQPQLLTVMPAGVRLQQLTPMVRAQSTIVRLMSPATTSSANPTKTTNQPLVIKAITSQTSNRTQQPILLTTNASQQAAQVLLLNQNTFTNSNGQTAKITLQMSNAPSPPRVATPTTNDTTIPQLDGSVDESFTRNSLDNGPTPTTNSNSNEHEENWHLVGTFKTTHTDIRHYYVVPSKIQLENFDIESLQVQNLVKKVDLEPGIIYKLRLAAVNSCGQGPWSEATAFKTCLPGSPPAPSNIRITKTPDGGAHLTWDPPSTGSSLITGYAVYLAVKNTTTDSNVARQQVSQMAFVRVYGGNLAECSVNAAQLQQAHLDVNNSSKPAIIFRIAARNERGYGPATQVRWLQDQQQSANNSTGKRTNTTNGPTKKARVNTTNNDNQKD